ncbi:putative monovalent cation/H+ antiporter subunit A [Afifella sp. IM 167]|uniref:putative monovalent cation/H+ antiporter subunit A n=1 Tax=Afifella sp. IM 167 TaxID=2033586 RepID=UPI001CCD5D8C|nr:putative monovalent cation/H+ antiporter subunit A [Afifella sp. IM 167]MBZ8133111.1 Na(+)/H(+) antiporter subunit A [Afifella sp. IM 167]
MPLQQIDWTYIAMAAPFGAALVAPLAKRALGAGAGWILALVPAAMFLHFLAMVGPISAGEVMTAGFDWVPQIGVRFSYRIDGLSLLFAILISGIGTLIIIYSGAYLKSHEHQGRFFSFMFLFMGAMLGLVLSDDFLALFVFWELTSITSFLLIGFDHAREASRRAALQALVITVTGGLCLLGGLLLLAAYLGIHSMSEAMALGDSFKTHALYMPVLVLILLGAFTKSAQFPFHSWLANAMEAPTPVSAYLHSATMVKAGVYLLLRVHPFMGGTEAWTTILPVFGGLTLIAGTLLALRQTDMKLILAYTTVASLGLLVMLAGTSTETAILGALVYLLAHSLFKGGLFMVAGTVDHEAKTRDLNELGGLARAMPITFAAALVCAWSMGGLFVTLGFFAKEAMYEGLLHAGAGGTLLLGVAVVGNGLMFAAAFAVALLPFIRRRKPTLGAVHEGPVGLWLGPVTLALCGVAGIALAGWTQAHLIGPTLLAVTGATPELDLSFALHFNEVLAFSGATWLLGIVAFLAISPIRRAIAAVLDAIGWGPDKGFDQFVSGISSLSGAITRFIQTGDLERYISVTFAAFALCLLVPLVVFGEWPSWPAEFHLAFYEWAVAGLAVAGLVAVLVARNRLIAIVSLGIQGFAVALIFMLFGAPDLSFTQFMVETLSVVILALVMTRLRLMPSDRRNVFQRVKDGTIAIGCGVGTAALLLSVTNQPFDDRLSVFFADYSRTIAHGRNIVNVILVDFRGLDTLGESAVVLIAGLAILALLRFPTPWRRRGDEATPGEEA